MKNPSGWQFYHPLHHMWVPISSTAPDYMKWCGFLIRKVYVP